MHIFITGATGYLGSAIVQGLVADGHHITGLARSDASAADLRRLGHGVHRGDVTDPESLASGARAADAVIHTAFIHDFAQYVENTKTDERAVTAIAQALKGTDKPFVATSGTTVLTPGTLGAETDAPDPRHPGSARARSEAGLAFADRGVRASVVRLPPSVHSGDDTAFVPALMSIAREAGIAAYVGDGANRWPSVHRDDAARLFQLALGAEPGTVLHGVDEEGIPFREIAQTIGETLGVPTRSIAPEAAADHFGWLSPFAQSDGPVSSALTRQRLGWAPREIGLLDDIRQNYASGA